MWAGRVGKLTQLAVQVLVLSLFAAGVSWLVAVLAIPLPASVCGLFLLLLLLALRVIPEHWLQLGAAWLTGELLLFFIPPVVSVIKYPEIVQHYGVSIIGAIVSSCLVVMLGTAWIVDAVFVLESRRVNVEVE
ncbi:holin-like protein [Sinobacterium caligoides]|uniref:Holin-like protein n=1 Tax=Sinobacterium caligoides TaxID=933926 RepID=A0A3N2DZX1_9GAMM|nr:CidA/LrgA family protein [Sinobacterium caligoides]ROS05378.1 holin-like protein [Sinobacterium caligoides]